MLVGDEDERVTQKEEKAEERRGDESKREKEIKE